MHLRLTRFSSDCWVTNASRHDNPVLCAKIGIYGCGGKATHHFSIGERTGPSKSLVGQVNTLRLGISLKINFLISLKINTHSQHTRHNVKNEKYLCFKEKLHLIIVLFAYFIENLNHSLEIILLKIWVSMHMRLCNTLDG